MNISMCHWVPWLLLCGLACGETVSRDDDPSVDMASPVDAARRDQGELDAQSQEVDAESQGVDAETNDAGAVACDLANEGDLCAMDTESCGRCSPDPCSFCNVLICDGGRWSRREAPPAAVCFSCGGARCVAHEQWCAHGVSDVGGEPDSYECRDRPSDCVGDLSCDCFTELGAQECADDRMGGITVTFFGG